MRHRIERVLDDPRTVYVASAISLALGLFFVFVWAPHPWGWEGIDGYHDLARALARGEPFPTMKVPWGYSYFVAAFYAAFGELPWLPLVFQVLANATVPLMLHRMIAPAVGARTATVAALITGVFSFNTIYASTQSSDAICTVLFTAALLCFTLGLRTSRGGYFVLSAILMGVVPQFRPNMLLFPPLAAMALVVLPPRSWRKVQWALVLLAIVGLAQMPWVVRNYRLTGDFIPTSTHGGTQLWYGTLQVGPYLESKAHNPRVIFDSAPFIYTSLADRSIVISVDRTACLPQDGEVVELIYWTDRQPSPTRVRANQQQGTTLFFELPGQPLNTVLRYYVEASWPAMGATPAAHFIAPDGGAANPFVSFVSNDHLGDMDQHGEVLDVFDLGRMLGHVAWDEPLPQASALDFDHDGEVSATDVIAAAAWLLPQAVRHARGAPIASIEFTASVATIRLIDGSTLSRPRRFSGRHTDFDVAGNLAGILVSRVRPLTDIAAAGLPPPVCRPTESVRLNEVFYRGEPHVQRRHLALALDNIRHDPAAFAAAAAYRLLRLFVIRGTEDRATTQQFEGARLVYGAGLLLSAVYFSLFLAGSVVAWRQRSPLLGALVPILYVPLTICFVLSNMRYTVTVQPLMFAMMAVAVVAAFKLNGRRDLTSASHGSTEARKGSFLKRDSRGVSVFP